MTRLATPAALAVLDAAAHEAGVAETRLRENFAREIERLEAGRRRAYRRFHFLAALIAADAGAPDRGASRAAQRQAAAEELDWDTVDVARAEVLDAMETLADAVHDERLITAAEAERAEADEASPILVAAEHQQHDDRAGSLLMALAAFEARFEEMRGRSFVELFDRHMPDTPLVDF